MKTRAAVAFEKGKPLTVTEVELDGPKAGEVSGRGESHGHLPHRRFHAVRR
jgi:Zn-dependent alcohol dehydrogenase